MKNQTRGKYKFFVFSSLIILIIWLQGCHSEKWANPYSVKIDTSPSGAVVKTDKSKRSCISPCELSITDEDKRIIILKNGYKTEEVVLKSNYAPAEVIGGIGVAVVGAVYIGFLIHPIVGGVVAYGTAPLFAGAYRNMKFQKEDIYIKIRRHHEKQTD